MLGRVRHDDSTGRDSAAYRGPERRGADRVPPPLKLEDPSPQFWWRAALVAPLVGACALAAAVVAAEGLGEVRTAHASLRLCWCVIALATGAGFALRWRLTGEAAIGLLGAALVVWSLPQLPFALADVAGDPDSAWRRLGPLTRMTVMVPAAWLLLSCIRTPQVDSALRPWRQALGYSLAATVAAGALTTGQMLGLVAPSSLLARSATDAALAVLMLLLAVLFARRAHALEPAVRSRAAVAFAGLGMALVGNLAARIWLPPAMVFAEFAATVAMVVLALLALSLLRSAVDFYGLRLLSLRLQADSAEDAVRREQERMHELRATVAGIRQASGTLSRHAHRLDPARERDLQQMMAAELTRLERLLDNDVDAVQPGPVMLDDVIRPLVVGQRELGVTVHWRPTGACVLGVPDAVSEIVNTLLTNARVHARGARVAIVVQPGDREVRLLVADNGPGVPAEMCDRLFERGCRRDGSPGQGLGLPLARSLAIEGGGDLRLLPVTEGEGSRFLLTLPALSDPRTQASRPQLSGRPEETT